MPLSTKISNKISSELDLSQEKKEIINYGAAALIHILLSLIIISLFGRLFDVLIESLIVTFSINVLRQFSGGKHASKPSLCIVIGTAVTIFIALLAHYAGIIIKNEFVVLFIGVVLFTGTYYIICEKVPVDSKAKPITNPKKKKRMKKISLIIISLYVLLSLTLIMLYIATKNRIFSTYILCIYGGVAWQVFTLTITGDIVIEKIDKILGKIIFRKDEV